MALNTETVAVFKRYEAIVRQYIYIFEVQKQAQSPLWLMIDWEINTHTYIIQGVNILVKRKGQKPIISQVPGQTPQFHPSHNLMINRPQSARPKVNGIPITNDVSIIYTSTLHCMTFHQ